MVKSNYSATKQEHLTFCINKSHVQHDKFDQVKKKIKICITASDFWPSQRLSIKSSLLLLVSVVVYHEVLCGLPSKAIMSSIDFAHVPVSFHLRRCRVTIVIFSTAQSSNPHRTIITVWLAFQGTCSLESFSVLFEMIYRLSCDPQN